MLKIGVSMIEESMAEFDEKTRIITWRFSNLESLDVKTLRLEIKIKGLKENISSKEIQLVAKAFEDGKNGTYESIPFKFSVGQPILSITQTSPTLNTYVKEGETITYKFIVENKGSTMAKGVILTDRIPEGLVAQSVKYKSNGPTMNQQVSEKNEAIIRTSISAECILEVEIVAMATDLKGEKELKVTNIATVEGDNIEKLTSNEITHIVEGSEIKVTEIGESSSGNPSSVTDNTPGSTSKTYKIEGVAWLDENKDGMRTDNEKLMKDIKATLVESNTGTIKQVVSTNSNGEYVFNDVTVGNYMIIFDYDTVSYTVTTYKKENVPVNVNSDAISTKVEQDGILRNGAVTDIIAVTDRSISNIDIGLAKALKFDLSLNMGISKITVQNSKGTNAVSYKNVSLAKTEIGSKQLSGSEVYIEYTFTVKNEGEVPGYAKKIVDYIPSGMNFNSGLNSSWYTGSDGNLYTNQLDNSEIQPGETKTFKLVLSKTMTNDNLGVVTNTAEICEDYNIYGISDIDSVPGNKSQNEDDFARADTYVSVRTGEEYIYISVTIITLGIVGTMILITTLKLKVKVKEGGTE